MSTDYDPEPKGADLDDDIESLRSEIDRKMETNTELQAEVEALAVRFEALLDEIAGPADDETTD